MARVARRRWRPAPDLADVALGVFFVASSIGYVASQEWPGAWLLGLPVAAGLLLELDDVGDGLRRRGERDAWLLVGLAVVVGLGWTLYAIVGETLLTLIRGAIGSGLVLMGGFFTAGRRVWRPERGLIPSGLGALVVAGLDPLAPFALPAAIAVLALVAWLAVSRPTRRRPGAAARRPTGLVPFALLALGLAMGTSVGLPLAQPLVERAAADILATGADGVAGLSGHPRLGDIEQLALSREVVLRLWSDRPLRLRAHVLTRFDGRGWSEPTGPPQPLAGLPSPPGGALGTRVAELPGASYRVGDGIPGSAEWARVLVTRLERGQLVSPTGPRLVRIAGGTPLADLAGVLSAPFWPPARLYGVAHGRSPGSPPGDDERAAALQLPEGLDPRLLEQAARLSAGATGDRERLDRTLAWIGRQCHYSLQVGAFRSDQPVAEFLFEKKRGYCEYFASGAAILLRLQGVPTRYVNGFNVRDANRRGDHYLVRGGDAHAWIETWIEGSGWIEADPTPGAQYDALRDGMHGGPLSRAWEAIAAFFSELQARFGSDTGDALRWLGRRLGDLGRGLWRRAPWALGLLVAGAAVYGSRRLWRARQAPAGGARPVPPESVGAELVALVQRVDERWSDLGHPRPLHRAPLEHLRSLPDAALPAPLRGASREVVDCYYAARFGGRPPDSTTLARLRRELDEAAP